MDFSCKTCGHTVNNIPERFLGRKVRCHKCGTVQKIAARKPVVDAMPGKEKVWRWVNRISVGASFLVLVTIGVILVRSGGRILEKSGSIQLIIDVVLPVFGIMLAGYLAGLVRLLGNSATEALNRYVFFIALPALFVISMSRVPLGEVIILPFLAAFCGGMAATFAVTWVLGRMIFKDRLGVNALRATSAVYANTGYMGIPLFLLLFGQNGLLPAVVSAVVLGVGMAGVVTVLLELDRGRNGNQGNLAVNVLAGVVKSPLLLSAGAGMLLSGAGIQLPKAAITFCETLGASSGPCALFAIGLFMAGKPISSGALEVFWLTGMKLVVQPAVTAWLAFKVFALDPKLAADTVILSALPSGSLLFVFAQKYGLYVHRATSFILISTVMSLVTLSLLFIALGLA